MPRTKTSNPTQQIGDALNTLPDLEFDEVAQQLGISEPNLRDRLESKLSNPQVQRWELLPREHQSAVDQVARDLDAERSVRVLPQEISQPQDEPPILQEESEPQGKLARAKQPATGLTQKRKGAIDKTAKTSRKLGRGLDEAELLVEAQRGRKKGAKKAAVRLVAEEETYNEVLTKAAIQRLADAVGETEEEEEFDPLAYVRQAGSQDVDETLKTAMEKIAPVLGKLGEAANEVVDNSYSNGSTLDLSRLEKLMQSID